MHQNTFVGRVPHSAPHADPIAGTWIKEEGKERGK